VKLVEVDAHINDPVFAARLVTEYLEIKEKKTNDLA
jgi:uncharacterized protein (UPF0261 family)